MFVEPFSQGQTFVHRLDARLRVLVAVTFALALAVSASVPQTASGLGLAALLLAASKPPLVPLLRRLIAVNLFLLLLWLTVPFSTPGPPVAHWGALVISQTGLAQMTLITLKANAIACLCLACIATMPVPRFGHALHSLRLPARFVLLLLFTYRALFLLAGEWQRLRLALKLRGFVAKASLHSYRTLGNLLGLTLVNSLERAHRIHQAMLLRGFDGHFRALSEGCWTKCDTVFLVLALAVLALFVLSSWPFLH